MEVSATTEVRLDPDNLVTCAEGGAETGIPPRTLRAAAKRGAIASRLIGRAYLLDRESLKIYATHKHSHRAPFPRKSRAA